MGRSAVLAASSSTCGPRRLRLRARGAGLVLWSRGALVHSPFGLSLQAIRDNRLRAARIGMPVRCAWSRSTRSPPRFAGVAGALLAQTSGFASLDVFDFHRCAEVLLMLVIGGTGYLYGGLLGAIVFRCCTTSSRPGRRSTGGSGSACSWSCWCWSCASGFSVAGRPCATVRRRERQAPAMARRARDRARCCKRFGGIAATQDVSLALEGGARHALIGPNGAGKTTLVNLLTGVLTPTSGAILLDGATSPGSSAQARVRAGIVRTFQINQLFADLTPLETLALADRGAAGPARAGGGRSAATRAVADEASAARALPPRRRDGPAGRARSPTASSACSRSRSRWPAGRACCCSTSRSPAFPRVSARRSSTPSPHCRATSRSCSSSTTWTWSSASPDDHGAGQRRPLRRGRRGRDRERSARQGGLSRRGRVAWLSSLARRAALRAGYGEAVVVHGIDFALEAGQSLALLGRNGTGKTTLLNTIVGVTRRRGGTIELAGRDITALPPHPRAAAGIGWVPQERNIFRSLTVEENLTAVARPGAVDAGARLRDVPAARAERKAQSRQPALRRRAADARGRPCAGAQPELLLLDEPLEGLAPIIVEELLRSIGGWCARRACRRSSSSRTRS